MEDPQGLIVIQKRKNKDIWKGLYQFPLIESTSSSVSPARATTPVDLDLIQSARPSGMYHQQLTHQLIEAYFYQIRCALDNFNCGPSGELEIVSYDQLEKYPLPRIIDLYLSDKSITLV